jgi:DNA adenine methylase
MKTLAQERLDSEKQRQRYASPLRYPGGKGKVANFMKLVILENDLVGCRYVEPYAGGASVALNLLFEEYASHVHINDLNASVFAFWKAVLEQTDELCEKIESTSVSVKEWQRQRAIQADPNAATLDLAFSTFFLNRTNRSGIIGGGIIGGQDQLGAWKLDARYNRTELVRRIEKIGRFRTRITLTQRNASEFLREDLQEIDDAFVYLDPPYYAKGPGLYENFYAHDDHAEIARIVRALSDPWIVSYDAVSQIEALYPEESCLRYTLSYSAAERQQGSEIMFFSPGLKQPGVRSASGIGRDVLDLALAKALA